MSGGKAVTTLYVALPTVLWPVSFIVLANYFVYAMSLSTLVLGIFTILRFRDKIIPFRLGKPLVVTVGIITAFILYGVFVGGDHLLMYMGLSKYVGLTYEIVYSMISKPALAMALVIIGIMEELYWRGGLQELMRGAGGVFRREPWILSMTYYTLVHISTLNLALIAGAFAVGLIDGLLADKVGLASSIITHVLWLELIMVVLPLK
ncbi:CPBP family glutamic-type intramembrane protease [Vulcanisaeta thermophila]|uniref:CPBP family glutamic-type intramembrane protease n=1 Tax=Vulcanisaeta thermophila TaxID=867917 RepID=UPI000853824F|nr:CPBP family glutamic-type intramembrane protease [Vulcanisaeta thermophila]